MKMARAQEGGGRVEAEKFFQQKRNVIYGAISDSIAANNSDGAN